MDRAVQPAARVDQDLLATARAAQVALPGAFGAGDAEAIALYRSVLEEGKDETTEARKAG